MKTSFIELLCLFIVFSVISCQDTIEEYANSEIEESVGTRADQDQESTDYYWFKDKKIPLRKVENKSFVLFKSKDENSLINALSKNKISIDASKIKKYDYSGTDLSGNSAKTFIDFKCAEINIDVNIAYNYPEIVYAAPFFKTDVYPDEFPLTNLIYVFLKEGTDIALLEEIAEQYNIGLIGKFENFQNLYVASCTKESQGNALEIANKLYDAKLFECIEPAFIAAKTTSPNDPYYPQQWNLENTGQYGSSYIGYDINYTQSYGTCSSSIKIGVIDAGVQLTHPDLTLNSFSWDAYTGSSPSVIYGDHGTNVAGILGAKTNNSIGIAGIASGAEIISISNSFGSSTILAKLASSIIKAVDKNASVINNSWVSSQSNAIENAITYAKVNGRDGKGSVLVFATGNDNNSTISYPACHTPEKDVISVGAISFDGKRKSPSSPDGETWWGSNYGTNLDIVAPGVKIPTTSTNSSYITDFNGTSAATPHVSGVAALILSNNPNLYYDEVGLILQSSANKSLPGYTFSSTSKIGGTWNNQVGHGLLDMYSAISLAQSVSYPNSGSVSLTGGQTTLDSGGSGYVGTTFTASPNNSNYNYYWSGSYTGTCDRWYVTPNTTNSPIGNVSVYLNSGQSGVLAVTCRVYSNSTFIGSCTKYVNVSY